MVDLNVGGVVFETSRATLTQQAGSYLESVVSGRHAIPRDRQGRIFIDRDSELFRSILNFLRNPAQPPMPRDAAQSEALCAEASSYGIRYFPFPLVFACGGHSGFQHLREGEVLDVGGQCWRPCRSMNSERTYFGSAVLGSRPHVFGGQNLDYKALCEMEIYDCLRDTWIVGASLSQPRRNCAGIAFDNRIFAIGGFDGTNIIASVEAYDARMKKWEVFRADMIETRSAGAATSCVNHLFVMGGTDNTQQIHYSMECLDMDSCQWSFRKNMTVSRMDHACCTISDSILVGGGQNGDVLATTEFYLPELEEWKAGPSMLTPRC